MKLFYRILFSFFILFLIAYLALFSTGNLHLFRAVKSTYLCGETGPSIEDAPKFLNRTIRAKNPALWADSTINILPNKALLEQAEKWESTSLLLVKNKKIIFEKYWGNFSSTSLTNSFSMAKSFVSIAIGVAIRKGEIKSLYQPVGDFIPEFQHGEKAKIRIIDLLQMSSGIDFGESYGDPFGFMAKAYYGKELYQLSIQNPVAKKPGVLWKYQGGNTLLLSFILKKASGKSLSAYFEDEIWSKVNAKEPALWTISEQDSLERAYCCFYSNARDFARLGQLYLDSGKWNDEVIVNPDYVLSSTTPVNLPDENNTLIDYYGLHWWLGEYNEHRFFYARGILGQYIVVFPDLDLVLVRLGHKRDKTRNVKIPSDLFVYLDIALELGQ